jgi:hypothetical protein
VTIFEQASCGRKQILKSKSWNRGGGVGTRVQHRMNIVFSFYWSVSRSVTGALNAALSLRCTGSSGTPPSLLPPTPPLWRLVAAPCDDLFQGDSSGGGGRQRDALHSRQRGGGSAGRPQQCTQWNRMMQLVWRLRQAHTSLLPPPACCNWRNCFG